MKKAVLKLDLHDEKDKKKAMKTVSSLSGVDSISMDMKDKKLTVIGDVDPVHIVSKLRKVCRTEIITVGPAKEPEKKKEEPKKAEEPKKPPEDPKKKEQDYMAELAKAYQAYYNPIHNPIHNPTHYHVRSVEDDPNACVIC